MAPSSGWALQQAIYGALSGDGTLLSLLGGPRIFDDVPQNEKPPYMTFAQSLVRDWSAGDEDGDEHIITLHIWSEWAGRKQVHEIMAAVRGVLHDADLTLSAHRLVNLRHEFSDARREPGADLYRGVTRYRAVTEPTA